MPGVIKGGSSLPLTHLNKNIDHQRFFEILCLYNLQYLFSNEAGLVLNES